MKRCINCWEPIPDDEVLCHKCHYNQETPPPNDQCLAPGFTIQNRYLLGRVLGQGGFGITYTAYDLKLGRKLAIKEFYPSNLASRVNQQTVTPHKGELTASAYQKGVKSFLDEAIRLAQFQNIPQIVKIFDCIEDNNTAYIIMELLEGHDLSSILRRRKTLPFVDACKVTQTILQTLEIIHKSGIVHRDISPANIFVTNDGTIKLIDFGASRNTLSQEDKSISVVLKTGYAPVEQYQTRGKQGPWTDVYAVGATFYRMITGRTPQESLERMLNEDTLVKPSAMGVKLPPAAEEVLMKSLSIMGKDRYQSAAEFRIALEQSIQHSTGDYSKAAPLQLSPGEERIESLKSRSISQSISQSPHNPHPTEPLSIHIPSKGSTSGSKSISGTSKIPPQPFTMSKHVSAGSGSIPQKEPVTIQNLSSPAAKSSKPGNSKPEKKLPIPLIIGGILIVILIAAFALRRKPSDPTKENTDTIKTEATATPKAEETAAPTATAEPTKAPDPTETPKPTETAKPTETPVPTETPAAAVIPDFSNVKVGDTLQFGTYEQDNDLSNGSEPIDWIVLYKDQTSVMLTSVYGLDVRSYHTSTETVSWADSSLRTWLNDTFLNTAFSDSEQEKIQPTTLTTLSSGNASAEVSSTEHIFLLSAEELKEYYEVSDVDTLNTYAELQVEPTAYARSIEPDELPKKGFAMYWLRSNCPDGVYVSCVSSSGAVLANLNKGVQESCMVRPALYVSID